jgi:hypothetical protein
LIITVKTPLAADLAARNIALLGQDKSLVLPILKIGGQPIDGQPLVV